MATPLKKKTGPASTSFPISMGDINHRLGNSETAEISLDDNPVKSLFYHNFQTTETMDLQEFLNKTKIVTGTLFSSVGYQDDYLGTQIGSITEDRMATASNGGWYGNSSQTQHTIRAILWNQSSNTSRFYFRAKESVSGNNATDTLAFSRISVEIDSTDVGQNGPYTKQVFKSSYANYQSSVGAWTWTSSIGDVDDLGSSSNLTRYIQIE